MTFADLDGALRASLASPMTSSQRAALDGRLHARIKRPTGFHVRRRGLIVGLAALLLVIPTMFAVSAAIHSTESPFGLESAAAFQAEIDAAKSVVPLPSGAAWPSYLAVTDWNGGYATGGGRSWVETVSFCAWGRSWLGASAAGRLADVEAARAVLLAAPTWEFYRGPFADQSYRDVLDRIVAAVGAGNAAAVERSLAPACGE